MNPKVSPFPATADLLSREFRATLPDRVARQEAVRRLPITPHTHFALVSQECSLLFRDGYFFACVSLTQAVAEALARFLCAHLFIRARGQHESRVKRLLAERAISAEAASRFSLIHEGRDAFHHLNPSAPNSRPALQAAALQKLEALAALEAEVFAYSIHQGALVPKDMRLWSAS